MDTPDTGQHGPAPKGLAEHRRGQWRHAGRLLLLTVLASLAMSLCLELLGWTIVRATTEPPPAALPIGELLRGAGRTLQGAMALGVVLAAASLLLPQTRRNPWHRVPLAFALGSAAFLCFLGVLSLGFILP